MTTQTLEYGRDEREARRRRRTLQRGGGAGASPLAAAAVARFAYPPMAATLSRVQRQRACMTFRAPADQVVYDEFMDRYATYTGMEHFRPPLGSPAVWYMSRRDPPQWAWLQSATLGRADDDTPLAFMHGRRSAGAGNERLVVIELGGGIGDGHLFYVRSRIFRRASVLAPLQPVKTHEARVFAAEPLTTYSAFRHRDARVFAGRPSDDPSAFSIVVETEDKRRTLFGRLLDDDTIAFEGGSELTIVPWP